MPLALNCCTTSLEKAAGSAVSSEARDDGSAVCRTESTSALLWPLAFRTSRSSEVVAYKPTDELNVVTSRASPEATNPSKFSSA